MKKLTLPLFIFALLSNVISAQTTKYIYFDADWNVVTSSDYYSFYRILKYSSSGSLYSPLKDYYRDGSIQAVVYFDKIVPSCAKGSIECGVENGNTTWYDKNGNVTGVAVYENGRRASSYSYLSTSNDAAKHFAHIATTEMMENISPNTGTSPAAYIESVKFDNINNQFEIKMSATWRAGRTMLSDLETFSIDGILRCGENGEYPSFIETYRNAAVRGAWSNKDITTVIKGAYMIYKATKKN